MVDMPLPYKEPEIQLGHIDGPLLHYAGRLHWLTLWERIQYYFGWTTPVQLARKKFLTN